MFLAINLAKFGFLEESLSFNKHSVGWGKYEGVREREEYKKQSLLRLADAQEIREPPRGSPEPESACLRKHCLEVALVLLPTVLTHCPDMGEASSIVSNLETLPTSSSHTKGKEELDTTPPNTTADGAAHGLSLDRVREETLYEL